MNPDVEAVILSDQQGFIIAGEKKKDIDLEIVSVLTSIINPILERIRDEFAFREFGTATFDPAVDVSEATYGTATFGTDTFDG